MASGSIFYLFDKFQFIKEIGQKSTKCFITNLNIAVSRFYKAKNIFKEDFIYGFTN